MRSGDVPVLATSLRDHLNLRDASCVDIWSIDPLAIRRIEGVDIRVVMCSERGFPWAIEAGIRYEAARWLGLRFRRLVRALSTLIRSRRLRRFATSSGRGLNASQTRCCPPLAASHTSASALLTRISQIHR